MTEGDRKGDGGPGPRPPRGGRAGGAPPHPEGKRPSVAADITALATGLKTTLGEFFSPAVTLEYPEDKSPRSERYRGRHYLRPYETGLGRCLGCGISAAPSPPPATPPPPPHTHTNTQLTPARL